MRTARWLVGSLFLATLSACSSCREEPSPPAPATVDAGQSQIQGQSPSLVPDAGVSRAANDPIPSLPSERPFDYPVVDDAPEWAWPLVQVVQRDGKQQLQVVGWAKNITNPQLAMSVAQAKARANLVKALQEKSLTQPGATEGVVAGAVFAHSYRSKTGAVFSAVVVDLP